MKTLATSFMYLFFTSLQVSSCPGATQFNVYDYAWLAGNWTGDGFGGTSEEIWSPPSADGTMMGMYRHHNGEGELVFYEFMVLDKTGMRIKHFSPGLNGWETKDDFVSFEMIIADENKIELDGLVMERISSHEMIITVQIQKGDTIEAEVFNMKRAKL